MTRKISCIGNPKMFNDTLLSQLAVQCSNCCFHSNQLEFLQNMLQTWLSFTFTWNCQADYWATSALEVMQR